MAIFGKNASSVRNCHVKKQIKILSKELTIEKEFLNRNYTKKARPKIVISFELMTLLLYYRRDPWDKLKIEEQSKNTCKTSSR
ncbi:hypothetical protein B566_EDAN017498, partial [Ephemera danica]